MRFANRRRSRRQTLVRGPVTLTLAGDLTAAKRWGNSLLRIIETITCVCVCFGEYSSDVNSRSQIDSKESHILGTFSNEPRRSVPLQTLPTIAVQVLGRLCLSLQGLWSREAVYRRKSKDCTTKFLSRTFDWLSSRTGVAVIRVTRSIAQLFLFAFYLNSKNNSHGPEISCKNWIPII